jgi:hypothetical protein
MENKAASVLTDDEIERVAQAVWTSQGWDGEVGCSEGNLLIASIRYIRDNGYLAPAAGLTVEEVMEIMQEISTPEDKYPYDCVFVNEADLRIRLTAAIEAKHSKPWND